ncbi:hypothetical protein SAMN06297422_13027 [Lachnospiraceae bacterium]|nr:hypothetical protein SAMN06297422_13027 [Lachnospiraceae bacterium]
MEKSIRDKILFILPPIVLALLTIIWYVRADGRWYSYRSEWEFLPLLACHLIMPLYYLVRLIIAIVKQIDVSTRSSENTFYIVASAILWLGCGFGVLVFLIFTSGR